ncbi:heme ABC transporter substrate-binding protein IsdE [Paenibacillus sp. NPDC058071]|uniref:heme ABC transporter substrate-binding protein IsdE n=1 Tax=Paenibacillus sp. NPDC058071 TaxID=3346326 RepID=UPI0036DA7909
MNRTFIAIIGLLLLCAPLLAGCGGSGSTANNSTANQPAEGATAEPNGQNGGLAGENDGNAEHRIVATTVAATQIMDMLGIDLVGVPTSVKTLPSRYDGVTRVGSPMSPDMELVKSLKPTEVLSVTTLKYELEPVFENAKVPASFLDLTSLDSMRKEIETLGERFGKQEKAAEIVKAFDATLEHVRQATEGKEKPTVLILLGVPGSYLVATEHSYIGDLVRLLGGVNIVQDSKVEFLASNTEYLHKSNPDVILRAAHGMPDEVVKMFDEEFRKNDIWKHFKAVQTGQVYDLEESLFGTTANLAVGEALEALLPMLYP